MKASFFIRLVIVLVVFVFPPTNSFAQNIEIGAGGGRLYGVFYPFKYMGFEDVSNAQFGIKAKFPFGDNPADWLNVTGAVNYINIYGDLENWDFEDGYGEPGKLSGGMFTFTGGFEVNMYAEVISPYIAFDFMASVIQETKATYPGRRGYTVKGGTRAGLGIGAGAEFKFLPYVNIDISARANYYNLVGGKSNENTIPAVSLSALVMYRL